jgi:hypothetical protein
MVNPAGLFGSYQQRYLVAKREKLGGKWQPNFAYEALASYLLEFCNVPYNLITRGRQLYFLSEGSRATDFYRP